MIAGFSIALVATFLGTATPEAGMPKDARDGLDGTWYYMMSEKHQTGGEEQVRLEIAFHGNDFVWAIPSWPRLRGQFRIRVDTQQRPAHIDWLDELGVPWVKGLYELEGDTLRICVNLRTGERPNRFKENQRNGDGLMVFKRAPRPSGR